MEEKVRAYCLAHGMLVPGERILCACSGGADSVALLHLLRRTEEVTVVCAHFNHCLRDAESDRDETFVRELCARWGVEFYAGRGDVRGYAAERGLGIEEAARLLRYRFLEATAEEAGCSRIATAHNADDNAETVLLNLVRGTGTRGLAGIPAVRGRLIRPLLGVTRREILNYLEQNSLEHVEDSSNQSDDYARNRVRHRVLPALRELNSKAVEHICSAGELLREDEDYLDGLAADFIKSQVREGAIPIPPLLELPRPVAMRCLRRFLISPGREHLERVYAFCQAGRERAALDLPFGKVYRESGFLCPGAPSPAAALPRRELMPGEVLLLPEIGKQIESAVTVYPKEIHNSFNTFYFKYAKICGRLYVASRAAGDSIRLDGRGCTKTVKKLFSEARLPLGERSTRIVISDEAGVAAVEGFGIAERLHPEPGDRVLELRIE